MFFCESPFGTLYWFCGFDIPILSFNKRFIYLSSSWNINTFLDILVMNLKTISDSKALKMECVFYFIRIL